MQLAMQAAGFTAGEADNLRRAMGSWERQGDLHRFKDQLASGLIANHYPAEFAERICKQIEGFGEYGFPESHAASFALLVYDSAWLKHYEPAAFTCALLNSQPMGFYAPAQLVQDARRHGVEVRPVTRAQRLGLHAGAGCDGSGAAGAAAGPAPGAFAHAAGRARVMAARAARLQRAWRIWRIVPRWSAGISRRWRRPGRSRC